MYSKRLYQHCILFEYNCQGGTMLKDRLKTIRLEKGLTMVQVAEKLGVSYPVYSQWERGKRTPKEETIQRLAKALDVTPDYLAGRTGDLDEIFNIIRENNPTENDKEIIATWLKDYFKNRD